MNPSVSWMPALASDVAQTMEGVFGLTLFVALFLLVAILGLLLVLVLGNRRPVTVPTRRAGVGLVPQLLWVVLPAFLFLGLYLAGIPGYLVAVLPQAEATTVHAAIVTWEPAEQTSEARSSAEEPSVEPVVEATPSAGAEPAGMEEHGTVPEENPQSGEAPSKTPAWAFTYDNGYADRELHLPAGRKLHLVLDSAEKAQGLLIPAFRVAAASLPGHVGERWFTAEQAGRYELRSTAYNGVAEAGLSAAVIVQDPTVFDAWLEEASDLLGKLPPAEAGALVYKQATCNTCHTVDGKKLVGPSFRGIWGRREQLSGGGTIVVDEAYVRESLFEPQAKVVAGYEKVAMPSFKGQLTDEKIDYLIAYMKLISEEEQP